VKKAEIKEGEIYVGIASVLNQTIFTADNTDVLRIKKNISSLIGYRINPAYPINS